MIEVVEHEGAVWVPGNRWDVVAGRIGDGPRSLAAVVVTHFEQPASLARMYGALADLDPDRFELVVTDDGSREPPPPPPDGFPLATRMVRQDDLGCRPGAARNLGAAATAAEVLVFLDADTVPAPGTVARLAAWPDLVPDALVVGRRGHVDLTGWSVTATVEWLAGRGEAPPRRPDPEWLADGYRASGDLREVDDRSYRYVISAVMACHRRLWDDIGGFDGTRDEYGSDDWEFASRAFNNGAVLVHEPRAVGWHDEPDWAQRDSGGKNDETLWLATVVAEPVTRGGPIRQPWPDTLVDLDVGSVPSGVLVAMVGDLLDDVADAQIRLPADVPRWAARHLAHDSRLSASPASTRQRQRARHAVTIQRPTRWPAGALGTVLEAIAPGGAERAVVVDGHGSLVAEATSTRWAGRCRRAGAVDIGPLATTARFTTAALGVEVVDGDVDLAAVFRRRRQR